MRETEPTVITQGEALEWTREFCDYPATLWTLQYRFRGVGTGFDSNATADGDKFAVSVPIASTLAMGIGKYQWQAWVTEIADSTNKIMIADGDVTVKRGFVASEDGTVDLRTTAKKILDAVEATLLGTATGDQLSYEITTPAGTTKIMKMSRGELLTLKREYAAIVKRENAAERIRRGGSLGKRIVINVRER
jgi:hypothetical protein